jgi:hypothetical protein
MDRGQMNRLRPLAILSVAGLFTLGLAPVAMAQNSPKMYDNSGSISNLVGDVPDVYPERYVKYGESTYTYQLSFNDVMVNLNSQNCVLTLNSIQIKDDTCSVVIAKDSDPGLNPVIQWGGIDLSGNGNYVLTANGNALLSWTFNRSADLPPNPKPTECVIKSVKPVSVRNKVMSLTILDNGKCNNGSWYYTYSGDPQKRGYAIYSLGKNKYGKASGSSLVMTKGSTVTVSFLSGDLFMTTVQNKFTLK